MSLKRCKHTILIDIKMLRKFLEHNMETLMYESGTTHVSFQIALTPLDKKELANYLITSSIPKAKAV